LQDAGREPAERLTRGIRVNGGQAPTVPGIERLEQIERLTTAHFPNDHAIGTVAEGRPQQIANGDRGRVRLGSPRLEPHDVRVRQPQLGRVFDHDQAFFT